jgi:hypothetical protein
MRPLAAQDTQEAKESGSALLKRIKLFKHLHIFISYRTEFTPSSLRNPKV